MIGSLGIRRLGKKAGRPNLYDRQEKGRTDDKSYGQHQVVELSAGVTSAKPVTKHTVSQL